jgi:glycolate oxidase FAD binding subunit
LLKPVNAAELAEALACAAGRRSAIALGGCFTKRDMAGPAAEAEVTISTAAMTRVLKYEPDDLTISVEAGIPYAELCRVLAARRQMIPLDPPFSDSATVGGILASNTSGQRRRLYGTARDQVIGMKFATLEGKLIESGGMVVKNVAGLDMSKLLIGSFGTLAAIAVANLRVQPMPERSRTFVLAFDSVAAAIARRNAILAGVLQPVSLDLLNESAAARAGLSGAVLLVGAAGNAAVIARYAREFPDAAGVEGDQERALWESVREFGPRFLAEHPEGAIVRVSCTLAKLEAAFGGLRSPVVARAASGVVYAHFPHWREAGEWMAEAGRRGLKTVIEFAPAKAKTVLDLWPAPGADLELMMRIKRMFDPELLLNRGRLYGRI